MYNSHEMSVTGSNKICPVCNTLCETKTDHKNKKTAIMLHVWGFHSSDCYDCSLLESYIM